MALAATLLPTYCRLEPIGFKAGFNLNVVLPFLNMDISRSHSKKYKNSILIPRLYALGCFMNFWVIFEYILDEI